MADPKPAELLAKIEALSARLAKIEAWQEWFKAYVETHPGGIAFTATPPTS